MQSLCRTWPPNGSSRIRVEQRLRRKHREACKSSWSRIGSLKSFTLRIPWNLARLVKIFPGIIFTSTPHRSETNGIAERAVRRVKEGTSAVLLQSGLNENWWADSMKCYCYLRNVTDLLSDGKTPYERRFGQPLNGPIFPCGHWLNVTLQLRRTSQESINLERKSYLDCSLDTLCPQGGIWKGDVLVADLRSCRRWTHRKSTQKKLNAKEVIFPKEKEKFNFPIADGRIKPFGGDQDLRTSTSIRQATNSRRKSP